jgi:hypothetical protein
VKREDLFYTTKVNVLCVGWLEDTVNSDMLFWKKLVPAWIIFLLPNIVKAYYRNMENRKSLLFSEIC